jgi:two-component system, NarL family, response regulator DevR
LTGAPRIGIVVIEEHTAVRDAIRLMCQDTAELEFLSGGTAISQDLPGVGEADVILVGIKPSTEKDDLAEIRARSPRSRIVLLVEEEDERVRGLLRAADAAVSKRASVHRIVDVLRRTAAGLVTSDGLRNGEPPGTRLSSREREVLALLAQGLTNRQIADSLGIASRTTASHIAAIYRKLGVSGRVEATRRALELGIAGAGPVHASRGTASADT